MAAPVRDAGPLDHGQHVCAVFGSPAEQQKALSDFVRHGLAAGDQVVYLAYRTEPAALLFRLAADGLAAHRAAATGQLRVQHCLETYLDRLPFDPAFAAASVESLVERALRAGFAGLRLAGDMTWAARGVPGSNRLLEYEALVNEVCEKQPAVALCQYDGALFDRRTADAAAELHSHRLVTVLPPAPRQVEILAGRELVLRGEIDLATQPALTAAVDQLERAAGQVRVRLAELQFIDGQGVAQLMRLHRPGRPLVLHDAPPLVTRILEVCWPETAAEVRHS